MAQPSPERVQAAEQAVLRLARARGYLSLSQAGDVLRSVRPGGLLETLRVHGVDEGALSELEAVYAEAVVRLEPSRDAPAGLKPVALALPRLPRAGSRLGEYQLTEEVARGGIGIVFKALSPTGGTVAIKVLKPGAGEVKQVRFLREISLLTRLLHPNIIRIRDAGEEDGIAYLVMDLVEGETLGDRIHRDGPLQVREAANLTRKLALGLEYAHGQSVLHRDIKPDNVLLARDGDVFLTDFGLSRDVEATTRLSKTGMFLGTPGFWPPEQARGEVDRMGPGADVYGLGATLYMALTGRPPFVGETLEEILVATEQRPEPPYTVNPEVDAALGGICLRCLEKDPGDRYLSAGALASDLERYLAGEALAQSRPPLQAAVLASLALIVLVGGAWWTLAGGKVTTPAQSSTSAVEPHGGFASPEIAEASALLDNGGDLNRALKLLDRSVIAHPDDPTAWYLRADARYYLRDNQGAVDDADRSLAMAESGLTYAVRGAARLRLGDLQGALGDSQRALELEPASLLARLTQARAMVMMGQFGEAVVRATRILEDHPDVLQPLLIRGKAYNELGNFQAAAADLRRLVDLAPNLPIAHVQLAGALLALGDRAGAERECDRAIALDPTREIPYGFLLTARQQSGASIEEQLALVNRGLEAVPSSALLLSHRAGIFASLGELERSLEDSNRAIALDPNLGTHYLVRGGSLRRLGRLGEAVEDYRKFVTRAPTHPQANDVLREIQMIEATLERD